MNVYDLTKLELDPNAGGNCGAFRFGFGHGCLRIGQKQPRS